MTAAAEIATKYPLLLTTRQVCEILRVSRNTVTALVEAGSVRPVPLRGLRSKRYSRDAIIKLLER